MKNKKITIAILSVIVLVLVMIGITYAYWLVTRTQTKENVISTGCIDINLTNEANDIVLTSQYPMSDEEGMELVPYTFTISNTCNNSVNYEIALESMGTEENVLSDSTIKAVLNENVPRKLAYYDVVDPTVAEAYESHALEAGTLEGSGDEGASKTYNLRLWVDANADISEMNKTFASKISVTASNKEPNLSIRNAIFANTAVIEYDPSINTDSLVEFDDDTIYYVGEVQNNYVWFGGFVWRIVNVNPDGSLKLVTEQQLTTISFGEADNAAFGSLKDTYAADWLTENFLTNFNRANDILEVAYSTPDLTSEDSTWTSKVSLLTVKDAMRSGITDNRYADYYNHPALYDTLFGSYLHTLTGAHNTHLADVVYGDPTTELRIRYMSNSEQLYRTAFSDNWGIRPVITIDGSMILVDGNGTAEDPFVIEGEEISTIIADMHIGEYIKLVNEDLAKVVTIDSTGVKFVLDRNMSTTKSFGTTSNIFDTSNNFSETNPGFIALTEYMNSTHKGRDNGEPTYGKPALIPYLDTNSHNWNITSYAKGQDYKNITANPTISDYHGSYGLLYLSEMFSGYDISYNNGNIESNHSYSYLLTPDSTSTNKAFFTNGALGSSTTGSHDAIRPAFYLKTDLEVISGTGSYADPYIVNWE